MKKLLIYFFTILFDCVTSYEVLAKFEFNNYTNGMVSSPVDLSFYGVESNNVDGRIDNRFVAEYINNDFKIQFHLLSSLSNNYVDESKDIPINLVIKNDDLSLFRMYSNVKVGDMNFINKVDRLNFSYSKENYKIILGREGLTFSRGRVFHANDFFNPQNPGFYDGDYKIGSDLAYFNYGFNQQNNITLVYVPRRNYETKDVTFDDSTLAIRYSYNNDIFDYSFLIGQYLRDYTIATGASFDFFFGSVVRFDTSFWQLEDYDNNDIYNITMVGIERPFLVYNKTLTFFMEYFYNQLGYDGDTSSADYFSKINKSLIKRINNQDTYLMGKNYGAIGLIFEINQYTSLTYTNTINLYDLSLFNSFGVSYSVNDKLTLSFTAAIPVGGKGDEFGKVCYYGATECFSMGSVFMFSFNYSR